MAIALGLAERMERRSVHCCLQSTHPASLSNRVPTAESSKADVYQIMPGCFIDLRGACRLDGSKTNRPGSPLVVLFSIDFLFITTLPARPRVECSSLVVDACGESDSLAFLPGPRLQISAPGCHASLQHHPSKMGDFMIPRHPPQRVDIYLPLADPVHPLQLLHWCTLLSTVA